MFLFLMLVRIGIIVFTIFGIWLYDKNKVISIIQFILCGLLGLFFYKFTGIGEIGGLLILILVIWIYYDYHKENENVPNVNIVDKKKYWYIPVITVVVLFLIMLGSVFLEVSMVNTPGAYDNSSLDSSNSKYSFNSFNISDCKEINYKEIDKNPNKYNGENIKFSGKVMQISEGSSYNRLLMEVNGDVNQLVYVEYYNDTNIVEDDWITVYGVGSGTFSYETKMGRNNTVPSMYGASLVKN